MSDSEEAVRGFAPAHVAPLRYDSRSANPHESSGLLMAMIPEGARVLDVGCGTGSISSMVRDMRHAEVVGIEPHPERAAQAASEGLEVVCGIYSADTPERLGTFDVVLLADVLEHLVDPVALLDQVQAALKPGGRVLASIPNVAHWTVRLRLLAGKFDYAATGLMDATHLRWFTAKGVARLFEDAGYEIEQFQAAAGGWMDEYGQTPLRYLSEWRRSQVLAACCRVAPGLFAAQHIVSARVKGAAH